MMSTFGLMSGRTYMVAETAPAILCFQMNQMCATNEGVEGGIRVNREEPIGHAVYAQTIVCKPRCYGLKGELSINLQLTARLSAETIHLRGVKCHQRPVPPVSSIFLLVVSLRSTSPVS